MKNYRSFKDETTLTMQTAPYLKKHSDSNTFTTSTGLNLLKSSIIFGENGGGKSNIFEGISALSKILLNFGVSPKYELESFKHKPFAMEEETIKSPTEFEIILNINNKIFQYHLSYDMERIVKESLVLLGKNNDETYFKRDYNVFDEKYEYYLSPSVSDYKDKTRKNATYLSVLSQFNDEYADEILDWFQNSFVLIGTDYDVREYEGLIQKLENDKFKKNVLKLLKVADYNIIDLEVRRSKHELPESVMEFIKESNNKYIEITNLYTVYKKFDHQNNRIGRAAIHSNEESRGTQKMILIAIVLLDAFREGKTLLIDEFDSAFHLAISTFLLKLFNSKIYNKNSQFIMNTHETSLLDNSILRVDQFWFVEKDNKNSSQLYSLYDFNGTSNRSRSDISFAKDYLKGKFGAHPVINESILDYDFLHEEADD
ncbi:AAA family ATPase [Halobacillus sp. H74]|uniref:AAA family ATPase n=1 Tax=Halobacillus sp. H74 TaxID=3457436 RepID=UPI003FCE1637